jgi:hypothetical protein
MIILRDEEAAQPFSLAGWLQTRHDRGIESPNDPEQGDGNEDTCLWLCQPSMRFSRPCSADSVKSSTCGRTSESDQPDCGLRSDESACSDYEPDRAADLVPAVRPDNWNTRDSDVERADHFHGSGRGRGRAGSHDRHPWREHERARHCEPWLVGRREPWLVGRREPWLVGRREPWLVGRNDPWLVGGNGQLAWFDRDVEFGNRTEREFSVFGWYERARFIQHDRKCNQRVYWNDVERKRAGLHDWLDNGIPNANFRSGRCNGRLHAAYDESGECGWNDWACDFVDADDTRRRHDQPAALHTPVEPTGRPTPRSGPLPSCPITRTDPIVDCQGSIGRPVRWRVLSSGSGRGNWTIPAGIRALSIGTELVLLHPGDVQ